MLINLSAYFKVKSKDLTDLGVLDANMGIDNKLFVDPKLLELTKVPELSGARKDLDAYFSKVITLIKASKGVDDIAWRAARRLLVFKEEHGTALGYAGPGGHGRGIGKHLAEDLVRIGKEIVDLKIDASEMFELIGLFQDGFGSDLLSDMAVSILKPRFLEYTERITKKLKLKPADKLKAHGREWTVPVHPDGEQPLLFVPFDVLDQLPVALDRSEIWKVASFNDDVRRKWNEILAAAGEAKRSPSKTEIKQVFFSAPQNLKDLIEVYKKTKAAGYDFANDPDGLMKWEFYGRQAAEGAPIKIIGNRPKTIGDIRAIVAQIISQFRKNVEENKLYEVLYGEGGTPRNEVFGQRLFFAVADAYCQANDVDLSREPDSGNGPVDFKLSSGYKGKVLVEVKKSTSSHLIRGFTDQLPAYEKSESTVESVYLILQMSDNDSGIKSVQKIREDKLAEGKKVPTVEVVDARKRPSASKR